MSEICPDCERTYSELKKTGKLKYVQGYAQCGHCGGDLENDSVVRRMKNSELGRFECEGCGHEFFWHIVFVGRGPDECPRCHSNNVVEVIADEKECVLVKCSDCETIKTINGRVEDESLWVPNYECESCGRKMSPVQVMTGELAIYDEKENWNANIQM